MESRKTVLMNLSAGQQGRHRYRDRFMDEAGWVGRRGWDVRREKHGNIHYHM